MTNAESFEGIVAVDTVPWNHSGRREAMVVMLAGHGGCDAYRLPTMHQASARPLPEHVEAAWFDINQPSTDNLTSNTAESRQRLPSRLSRVQVPFPAAVLSALRVLN